MKTKRVHISLFGRFRPEAGIADDATVEVQDSLFYKSKSERQLLFWAGSQSPLIRNAALLEMANRETQQAKQQ